MAPHCNKGAIAALVVTLACGGMHVAHARNDARGAYPAKPVRVLVGYPAGGAVDATTRVVTQPLAERLGQPVVVDNRAGNTGNIAGDMLAKAPADGYTLYMATGINAVSVSLFKHLPFDPLRDFAPISRCITTTSVLVVTNGLPVRSVQELVAYAKANPGKLNYATTGAGGSPHLAAELLASMAGIRMVHVPYKGGPQSMQELVAGGVQLSFANIPNALPLARAGRIRALAITGAKRTPLAPDLPTIAESGYPGYDLDVWYGLVAPAKTPRPIIDRLNREVVAVLGMREIQSMLAAQGLDAAPSTPEELAAELRNDVKKYAKILRDAGIEPQ
jgi:tripartite-type tricarboxylate transporter receptor subunit TctC